MKKNLILIFIGIVVGSIVITTLLLINNEKNKLKGYGVYNTIIKLDKLKRKTKLIDIEANNKEYPSFHKLSSGEKFDLIDNSYIILDGSIPKYVNGNDTTTSSINDVKNIYIYKNDNIGKFAFLTNKGYVYVGDLTYKKNKYNKNKFISLTKIETVYKFDELRILNTGKLKKKKKTDKDIERIYLVGVDENKESYIIFDLNKK